MDAYAPIIANNRIFRQKGRIRSLVMRDAITAKEEQEISVIQTPVAGTESLGYILDVSEAADGTTYLAASDEPMPGAINLPS